MRVSDDVRALNPLVFGDEPRRCESDSELLFDLLCADYLPGIPRPAAQVRFDEARRWRLDRGWPAAQVGVELHGAAGAGGRHTRWYGFRADRQKINAAQLSGWLVLEFTTDQLQEAPAECFAQVRRALEMRTLTTE